MIPSQNGWSPANDSSVVKTYTVKGTSVKLAIRHGDAATVLLYVARRFHREVEPLHVGWCWGYAPRKIRGSASAISNHASGTAIDLNAPKHPLGVDPHRTFTTAQIAAIHRILDACHGTVRWGGDYHGRKDGMHFELNAGSADVHAQAQRILDAGKTVIARVLKQGTHGADVKAVQKALHITADGDFGPKTAAAVRAFKKAHHYKGVLPNAEVGGGTVRLLGSKFVWKG